MVIKLITCLIIVSLTVVFICSPAVAQGQDVFSTTDQFVKSILAGGDTLSVEAKGDLNGDGLADWAGVIHRQKQSPTYQLYVLLQQPGGGYRIAERSLEEEIAGMGCCWVEDLRIERSSIYIQNNAKTATTMEAATHQFRLYQGQWRLVGVKIYYLDNSKDTSTETDMNLLTGLVLEKNQKGSRKPTTKRSSRKFGRHLLKDFDFLNGYGAEQR
ncbi:MAG TPA: hypothetical protein VL866_04620 [Pyrinomonadaceae bacterium]|nr:hypothetical protein [Pyrinomonadaceae bacterium]